MQHQTESHHGWHQDQLHWRMTLWPQPIIGDHEGVHLESLWMFYEDSLLRPQIKALRMEDSVQLSLGSTTVPFPSPLFTQGSLWSMPAPPPPLSSLTVHQPLSLAPLSSRPFFCCNLFPEPISSMIHFFYLDDFLNKLSLIVLVSEFFPSQNWRTELLNQG